MKVINKELLEEKIKISKSFLDLMHNLGYSDSHNTRIRLKKLVSKYNIDISHFDVHHFSKSKALPIGEKICLYCGKNFLTKIGNKKELMYCSKSCANSINTDKRRSPEYNKQISDKLRKPPLEKKCLYCENSFFLYRDKKKIKYCSSSCASKDAWERKDYRENHSKNTINRIKKGNFGWKTRNELSFPEKLYKQFLEENGFKDKFINNYIVSRKNLDNNNGNYYLDFYFPDFNLDLEIDGQQHKNLEERIKSDKIRDELLSKNGYIIFRIEWREITTEKGKNFIKEQKGKLLEYLNGFVA